MRESGLTIVALLGLLAATGCGGRWDTPLMAAAARGDTAEIRRLVADGADLDSTASRQTCRGCTALTMAAGYGYTGIVELLLEKGADPRKTSIGGFTALVAAVRGTPDIDRFSVGSCQTTTVKALLRAAPDLKLPDNSFGKTARWASWLGHCTEVEKLLASAGSQGR